MGLSSRFAFHARSRDGPDRDDDHRETAQVLRRRGWRRALACLITAVFGTAAISAEPVRVALFHTELSRDGPGLLLRDIRRGDPQVDAVAEVVRHAAPDILLLGGIDWDAEGQALALLAKTIGGYPHRFALPPNRGRQTNGDVDGDGRRGEPEDAWAYGEFRGQKGMAILSLFPLDVEGVRDLTGTLWRDLDGNLSPEAVPADQRLSTGGHWIVPVATPEGRLHLFAWHATPPVFDGPEDMNGRRNHDEAAIWLDMLSGPTSPLLPILIGFANLDSADGDGRPEAIVALQDHPLLQDPRPASAGGAQAALRQQGANLDQSGDPTTDTVDWPDRNGDPGNLRVDYILPGARLTVIDAGVVWPTPDDPFIETVERASRHRLVWIDVLLPSRAALLDRP